MDDRIYGKNELVYYKKYRNGVTMAIMAMGSHPCTYVQFPGIDKVKSYEHISMFAHVHGGFTFLGDRDVFGLKGEWLGWDYAHFGDYIHIQVDDNDLLFARRNMEDHQYTLEELILEGEEVVEALQLGEFEIHEKSMWEEMNEE